MHLASSRRTPHIVDEMIELQGWDPEHPVTTHAGERTLLDALKKDYEVHMASSTLSPICWNASSQRAPREFVLRSARAVRA